MANVLVGLWRLFGDKKLHISRDVWFKLCDSKLVGHMSELQKTKA